MQINSPFFTVGAFITAPGANLPPPSAAQVSTAVAAMNAACFGPAANMQQCAVLSQSVGRIRGTAHCHGSTAASVLADINTGAAVPVQPAVSGKTVMAALAALGSAPPASTGLAQLC